MITIYVGRYGFLPKAWEGINGLYEKSEQEIYQEVKQEWLDSGDNAVDSYTLAEFEEEFNAGKFDGGDYWIKIFKDGKSVLQD
jgi:hypothetical protein